MFGKPVRIGFRLLKKRGFANKSRKPRFPLPENGRPAEVWAEWPKSRLQRDNCMKNNGCERRIFGFGFEEETKSVARKKLTGSLRKQ